MAVLGAGAGGLAAAARVARAGCRAHVYNRSPERLAAVRSEGGIHIDEDGRRTFVPVALATTDAAEALAEADVVLAATTANGQVPTVEAAAAHLRPGQLLVLLSGSGGSLEAALTLRRHGHDLDEVLLAETVTLPQSARMLDDGAVRVKLPVRRLRTAAFPARNTPRVLERLSGVLDNAVAAPHVLDTALNNPNFLIHPGPMLLNQAAIERSPDDFSLMNEGMTPSVLRCMDAIDAERMRLAEALELQPISIDDIYNEAGLTPAVYREPGEPMGLRDRVHPRYIDEDVPYGSVFMASLGDLLGIDTPVVDAVNLLLEVVTGRDFQREGRTVERLGIAGLDRAGLLAYLREGTRLG